MNRFLIILMQNIDNYYALGYDTPELQARDRHFNPISPTIKSTFGKRQRVN